MKRGQKKRRPQESEEEDEEDEEPNDHRGSGKRAAKANGRNNGTRTPTAPRSGRESLVNDLGELSEGAGPGVHRPGSIYRVTMYNFLTYSHVNVFPGPRLNLVIGPNGTGKSSLVCAICLGFNGNLSSAGRAEEVQAFIKKGEQSGFVELEIYKGSEDGEKNVVIRRDLRPEKGAKSSSWQIDGMRCTPKDILALRERLNIQVDNLCVFLAQERVVLFARMKPGELLVETEKAVDVALHQAHMEVAELSKGGNKALEEVEGHESQLRRVQAQLETIEKDVQAVRAREKILEKIDLLNKKRHWAELGLEQDKLKEIKIDEDKTVAALKREKERTEPIKHELETTRAAKQQLTADLEDMRKKWERMDRERQQHGEQLESQERQCSEAYAELQSAKERAEDRQHRVAALTAELQKAQDSLAAARPDREVETSMLQCKARRQEISTQRQAINRKATQLQHEFAAKDEECRNLRTDLDHIRNAKSRRMREIGQRNRDVQILYDWVENARRENKFKGPVFGPLCVEVNVTTKLHAAFVEKHIGAYRFAYVVTSKEDFLLLSKAQKQLIRYHITIVTCDPQKGAGPTPSRPNERMVRSIGGYLDEVVQCHDLVLQCLRNVSQLSSAVYANRPVDTNEVLAQRHDDNRTKLLYAPIDSTLTNLNVFRVQFSEYGRRDSSTAVDTVQPASFFAPFDIEEQRRIETALAERERLAGEVNRELQEIKAHLTEKDKQLDVVETERVALIKEREKLAAITHKINKIKDDLNFEEQQGSLEDQTQAITKTIADINSDRVAVLAQLKKILLVWGPLANARTGKLLDEVHLKAVINALSAELDAVSATLREIQTALKTVADAKKKCSENIIRLKDKAQQMAPLEKYKEFFKQDWMPDHPTDIDRKRMELQTQADSVCQDNGVLATHKRLTEEKEGLEHRITELRKQHQAEIDNLERKKEFWLPRLTDTVKKVGDSFAKYFAHIGCKGEIKLKMDEGFEKCGLEIWVQYREGEPLSLLSGTSQSGGERSVATMLYLLALQEVTDCPFRVVDEINQGMDPKNERMIFERIVKSCRSASTPQYFLVTPKLLPDLHYSDAITVLFVFNGAWLVANEKQWDVEEFMRRKSR